MDAATATVAPEQQTEPTDPTCSECQAVLTWRDEAYVPADRFGVCKRCHQYAQRHHPRHYVKTHQGLNREDRRDAEHRMRRLVEHERRWHDGQPCRVRREKMVA